MMKFRIPNSEFQWLPNGSGAVVIAKPIRHSPFAIRHSRAFTLMELMMVVAIIGLITAAGVPAILSLTREAPLRRAVNDVLEICSRARAQAILQGKTMTVVFHPKLRQMSFNGGSSASPPTGPATRLGRKPVNTTEFDHAVVIEGLGINNLDFTESDEARVRFFANGTSDEMTLVLSSVGEYRKITLEVTTALASVSDVR
ncbi:MAG TPA: GspH/FimT family pseudopilin [Verrucomicrobiae bacterium]|nr:GspH/FimT family pseudopilin [Verrucomicrobiae bacterium]